MILKVQLSTGEGFKIYSGFQDFSYIPKHHNQYRIRLDLTKYKEHSKDTILDRYGRPYVIEYRVPGTTLEGDAAWDGVGDYQTEYHIHMKHWFIEGISKPLNHAKLEFSDGSKKLVLFELGFLCNEAGETIEAIR